MTEIIGILNVTPDSFSDGGQFTSVESAIDFGVRMHQQGASLIDVGGESTRPGADRVAVAEELDRVMPVIEGLVTARVPVSIDTMNAETATVAAAAGVAMVNDVSGGLADPEMYRAVAKAGVWYIAMHWRGFSADMQSLATYDDVVVDVRNELKSRLAEMLVWGVQPDRVILDPGLGFAKTAEHNWQLLSRLTELESLGHPLMIGASRKRFLSPWGAEPAQRDEATAITSALAARAGVWGVRVHDVAGTRAALAVTQAWMTGRTP